MKRLYISLLSFVFITTSALMLSINSKSQVKGDLTSFERFYTPIPTLTVNYPFPIVSAQAALAIDVDSQVSLYEKNPDKPLLPASTTKIVTALTAMDFYSESQVLTVGKVNVDGQKMGLVLGEKIKFKDLLYGLLVYSANDAAEVLAQNYPGGKSLFVAAMNQKAREFHLNNSNFTNPTGLDGGELVSTARDLTRVSEVAMRDSRFAQIVGTKSITVKSTDGKIIHKLTNINELLGKVPGVEGVKTGWTEEARENLVTYIVRDDHKVMIALLGSQDRFGETKELIDWIFASYKWEPVRLKSLTTLNY